MSMLGFLHNFIFFFCLVFSAKSSIISITQHTAMCRMTVAGGGAAETNNRNVARTGWGAARRTRARKSRKTFFFSSWFIKSSEILFLSPLPCHVTASAAVAFSHPHSQLTEHNPSCSFIFAHSKLCFFLLTLCLSPSRRTAENDS